MQRDGSRRFRKGRQEEGTVDNDNMEGCSAWCGELQGWTKPHVGVRQVIQLCHLERVSSPRT
jgi:hypothetical protein